MKGILLCLFGLLMSRPALSQSIGYIIPDMPKPFKFKVIDTRNNPMNDEMYETPLSPTVLALNDEDRYQQQINQYELDRRGVALQEEALKETYREMGVAYGNILYTFPPYYTDDRTQFFYQAFEKLKAMDPDDFSLKEATFEIENAFYGNKRS